jgi:ABC-type antimicrobial peptide transport system permease subunit
VVGVAQDVRRSQLREGAQMHYYVPLGQQASVGGGGELVVRPRGDAQASIGALRALTRQFDRSIRYVDASALQDRLEPQTRSWRIGALMFSVFAGIALVVAAVGVFSIVAYLIEQRRHEIGIRIALGARQRDLLEVFAGGALGVTVLGTAIGCGVALLAAPLVQPLLFETSATDPLVIGAMASTLIIVALIASGMPALRVRKLDPATVLRSE